MSGFLRNLALRAAGLTPAAAPAAKTVIQEPAIVEEPVVEEEVTAPLQLEEKAGEAERLVEPAAELVAKAEEVTTFEAPVKPSIKPRPEVAVQVTRPTKAAPVEPRRPVDRPLAEPQPAVSRESVRRAEPAQVPAAMTESPDALDPVVPVVAVEEDAQPSAPLKEKELVFVSAPPLPPQIIRHVEERVREHVPAEAARVDVHIGRIEIVQPALPPPPAAKPPRKPRGFAEHRLERNYVSRRWY